MRTEETTIIHREFVYTEQEQERMLKIRSEIENIVLSRSGDVQKVQELCEELDRILTGMWSEPLPF